MKLRPRRETNISSSVVYTVPQYPALDLGRAHCWLALISTVLHLPRNYVCNVQKCTWYLGSLSPSLPHKVRAKNNNLLKQSPSGHTSQAASKTAQLSSASRPSIVHSLCRWWWFLFLFFSLCKYIHMRKRCGGPRGGGGGGCSANSVLMMVIQMD